ncbi:PREDICTED: membrane cofactor protein [Myotis brandtii]|uniref:membrane cofactor protein n=1 Tax=Myotis brandtii TaxID=109478 RepID=UPI0007041E35|nr:PREDICTED: membrane cofactor protein [Myotis brandtii]
MRASYEPLRTSFRRLESPFSWGYLGILVLALELLLPTCSGDCGEPPKFKTMKTKIDHKPPIVNRLAVEYECIPGYKQIDPTIIILTVCEPDGTYSPALQEGCTDACCELPRFESMKPKGDPTPPYNPGYQVKYECRPGYRRRFPILPSSAVCQPDNTWAPPLQEACTKKSCPQPREPPNGKIVYISETLEFGAEAHYACNEGYSLVGTKTLHCELSGNDVEWSEEPPHCEKILCQPPQQIANGEFTNSHKDTFEYNEVVTYSCKPSDGPDEYSLVGESKLVCSGRNQWSPDPPECKVVKCEYPALENGRLSSGFGKKFQYKSEVTFECLDGFYLEGSSTIVCGADSTWEPKIPKCIKVQDDKPPPNYWILFTSPATAMVQKKD